MNRVLNQICDEDRPSMLWRRIPNRPQNADFVKFETELLWQQQDADVRVIITPMKLDLVRLWCVPNTPDHADLVFVQPTLRERLGKLSGSDFDKQYMTAMISDHEQAVAAFEKESKDKTQTPVDKWASAALPTFAHHLQMAQQTGKEVGVTESGTASAVPASHVEHASKK